MDSKHLSIAFLSCTQSFDFKLHRAKAATKAQLDAADQALAKSEQARAQLEAELSLATTKIHQQEESISNLQTELETMQHKDAEKQEQLSTKIEELHSAMVAGEEVERKRARLEKLLEHKTQDADELEEKNTQVRETALFVQKNTPRDLLLFPVSFQIQESGSAPAFSRPKTCMPFTCCASFESE